MSELNYFLECFLLGIMNTKHGLKITTIGPNDGAGVPEMTFKIEQSHNSNKTVTEFANRYLAMSERLRFFLLCEDPRIGFEKWCEECASASFLQSFKLKDTENGMPRIMPKISVSEHLDHVGLSAHIETEAIRMDWYRFGSDEKYEGNLAQWVGNMLKSQGVDFTDRELDDHVRLEEITISRFKAWQSFLWAFKELNDFTKHNLNQLLEGRDDQLKLKFDF